MKYLLTLLMLSMALQPVALQACDMDAEQDAPHHAAMLDDGQHDCCDPDAEDRDQACDDAMQCGSCLSGISLVFNTTGANPHGLAVRHQAVVEDRQASPHSLPPFRPPIA